ncbi:MAG: hypothetical protein J6S04_06965 [Clostridia bacterium]|nr:hypothetical protein [Clostridia bacterium]
MKKIKVFFVALLTAFCCFALSACDVYTIGLYLGLGTVAWLTDEDRDAPSGEELRMPAEIVEGAKIVEITKQENGFHLVKVEGAIKNLGEYDSDYVSFDLSYYDENGYLLDHDFSSTYYIGAGDTYKIEHEMELFFEPATVVLREVKIYRSYDYASERNAKADVEVLDGETFTSELGEDGLYHATVTGQVKSLFEGATTIYIRVAFYDADGYLRVEEWEKNINGPAERTYTIEITSETEIVSHKVVYGSTIYYTQRTS